MTHRIFTSHPPEPITFVLDGQVYPPPDDDAEPTWAESFTALSIAPPASITRLLATVRVDTAGRAAYQVPAMISFVQQLLVPEDRARWLTLMADEHRLVEGQVLGELVEWLTEEVFGRPLVRRTGSASGPTGAASSSPPASSAPVAT